MAHSPTEFSAQSQGLPATEAGIDSAAFAAIVRGSLEAIIVGDEYGRVIEFNPAAEKMFGWSRKEAVGQSVGELIVPPHLRVRHQAGMERMRRGAPPKLTERRVEVEALRRDGSIFPCELSVARLEIEGPSLFTASMRDLSEIHEERQARREVEAFLRAISDDQTELIFRCDADMRIVFCNLAACRIYGVRSDVLVGRNMLDDVEESVLPRLLSELAALTPEDAVVHGTDPKTLPDGKTYWFEWTNRALFDAEGKLVGYQSVGRDVTDRVLQRQALAASEARLAAFMRNAPIGMYIKDGQGRYVAVNPEMEKVFKRSAREVIGLTAKDLMPAELVTVIDSADSRVLQTGRASVVEEHLPGADNYEWTMVVRFPIDNGEDGPVHIGGFDIDISAMKAAETELVHAREVLHQSEKLNALGSFATGVAHELNNPLAILAGQAELLAEDVADSPVADRAEMILRAADRCARIVQSFLAMVRQKSPQKHATDLNQLVESALEMAHHTLKASDVRVVTHFAEPSPVVVADPDQLHQVILNLIFNAKQSMDTCDGDHILTIETRSLFSEGSVVLDVTDTGPGISEVLTEQVFEPFYTTKKTGTGIGLAYCRRIIESHGGRISVVHEGAKCGKGAQFRIVLPKGEVERSEALTGLTLGVFGGKTALVVDDEAEVANLVAEMLQREDIDVVVADGGKQALKLLAGSEFDFVITDLRMPEVGGLEIYDRLKAERPELAKRTLFITGTLLDEDKMTALARTGRPCLEKPFRQIELRRALAAMMR